MRPDALRHAFFLFLLVAFALPDAAWAIADPANSGFSCQGGQPVGALFSSGDYCSSEEAGIFTQLICRFESILNEVMSALFCGMQASILGPLEAVLTLYVAISGMFFATGVIQGTAREFMIRMFKISLVYAFAANAEVAIGLVYTLFLETAREGIDIVLSVFDLPAEEGSRVHPALRHFDSMISQHTEVDPLARTINKCGKAITTMLVLFAFVMPPVALLIIDVLTKTFLVFLRAALGYLVAISGLTFLMTVSPVFAAFALFDSTYSYFEKWLHYMVTFALQMIIVFAFIGLLEHISASKFAKGLLELIVPYQQIPWWGANRFPIDTCTVCRYTMVPDPELGVEVPKCILGVDGQPIPIPLLELVENSEFMFLIVSKIIAIILIAFAMEAFLRHVPEMARLLAGSVGPRIAGAGGEAGSSPISLVGEKTLGKSADRFEEGFNEDQGGVFGKSLAGTRRALGGALGAGSGVVDDFIGTQEQGEEE